MTEKQTETRSKRRLTFVEDLGARVVELEIANGQLTRTADEMRRALVELVEACEAGGTVRYMEALGAAREVLNKEVATPDVE